MCISSFIAYAFLKQLQGTRPEPEAGSPFWRLASTKAPAICHLNFLDTEDGRGVMTKSKELPNFTISDSEFYNIIYSYFYTITFTIYCN